MKLSILFGLSGIALLASGCTGRLGATGPGGGGGSGTGNGGAMDPGTPPPPPFEAATAASAVRKVKNLLTGMTPTDDEIAAVTSDGAAGLQTLIDGWTSDATLRGNFQDKMIFLFRNAFQQVGFNPAEDFKLQLLTNGGFDFASTPGDDIFARLVQNLEDSFARTAWQLVSEGRPFSEVLTTQKFMMTTALKATYLQIEMPRDTRGTAAPTISWKVDEGAADIPIEDIVDPASPNYLTFADVAPTLNNRTPTLACRGMTGMVNPFTGFNTLFQVMLGLIPQYSTTTAGVTTTICDRHSSRPYFTVADTQDWQWVTVRPLATGETRLAPYDLPKLRAATELGLALPRVGFYTTPAFLALWNTNDSNQHRVTANQTLLVALGYSLTPANSIVPLSAAGLDANHAVASSECFGCHKSLDPMRGFWGNQYDYSDRNDFPPRAGGGLAANPRPASTVSGFAFFNMNTTGADMLALGPLLQQTMDTSDAAQPLSRFAIAIAQKLCFFANSAQCLESDAEFRRVARTFETSGSNFMTLLKEMLSSPLVTAAKTTATSDANGFTISIARRDQLCMALSNRLGRPDLCSLSVPIPATAQAATLKIATSLPEDSFSRGSEFPITATTPTLFYSSASELLCESVATAVVDATTGSVFSSATPPATIADMVTRVMGYPPNDPLYAGAVKILQDNYDAHVAARASATNAMRSTFALACEAPTTLSFGL
ncbi:MAG TPA: hypothetical protein VFH68_15815 [Polyangia bacterium]|nr:hypothetical protein [Polyangia bacterium]